VIGQRSDGAKLIVYREPKNWNWHHLYRAMAFLGEPLEEEPGARVLKTPRCTKDWIEEALFDQRRDLFSAIELVFFDTTSLYFEGEGGQEMDSTARAKIIARISSRWSSDCAGYPRLALVL